MYECIFDVSDVSMMYNCECNSVPIFVRDIHHIPYIVNNVMLFLDYMDTKCFDHLFCENP